MATKRPTRPTRERTGDAWHNDAIQKLSFWQNIKDFCQNERVHYALGIILIGLTLFFGTAFISFFFTGKADFSILEQPHESRSALREAIQNCTGLAGARVVHFFVDDAFGLSSIVILLLMGGCALALVKAWRNISWKFFFSCIFWLLWGSIVLSFLQETIGVDSFFRWGGMHGELLSIWLLSRIKIVGVVLVLIAALLVFLLCVDEETIPRFRRFGHWLKEKCKRKPKVVAETEEELEEDITIIPKVEEESDNVITLEITNPEEEDIIVEEEEIVEEEPIEDDEEVEPLEMEIETKEVELSEDDPEYYLKKLGPYDPRLELSHYQFPSMDLLKTYPNENKPVIDMEEQTANQNKIISTFRNFGIEIVNIKATIGPTVTLYEIVPKEGTKIARIKSLEDDIMMSLAATGIRMIAPMPGKGTIGIEVPNKSPQTVSMHSVIASKRFQEEQKMKLPIVMGKTITNDVFMFDLAKAPHLLVAGATGQGKSVGLNAIITSLLYKKHPSELKFVLVDPKMVEFSRYKRLEKYYMAAMPDYEPNDIIIKDSTKVINTLNSLVIEMEDRYTLLEDAAVLNLEEYNEKFMNRRLNPEKDVKNSMGKILHHRYLPYIVIIIDEYGDFISVAGREVEMPIQRITQKARAVGMHMILATQRPSVRVVTGIIKANIPSRIAFRTQSRTDSATVLDQKGAEGLVGRGDMLYSAGMGVTRVQCALVENPEVNAIVDHIAQQQSFFAPYELPEYVGEGSGEGSEPAPGSVDLKKLDPLFPDVARWVVANQQGSTSIIQRRFSIGYTKAGKLSDQLEAAGIVGPNKGPKGREVLVQDPATLEQILSDLL